MADLTKTRDWLESNPLDHTKFQEQPGHVRDTKVDVAERLEDWIYGFVSGETLYGFKEAIFNNVGNPVTPAGTGSGADIKLFGSHCGVQTELFGIDSGSNVFQITSGGEVYGASQYLKRDGTVELTSRWDAGSFGIQALHFISDCTTGQPYACSSTAVNTNLNADLLDGKEASEIGSMGTIATKDTGTTYQAATDGFVYGSFKNPGEVSANRLLYVYSDANPSPTTLRSKSGAGSTAILLYYSYCVPIKKDHYYKVTAEANVTEVTVYWMPLGT